MRDLPSAKMVRPACHRHGDHTTYNVIGSGSSNEGVLLGQVDRDYGPGKLPWNAYLAVEHPTYGPGVRHLKSSPFSTRQEALLAVLHAWQAQEAELEAHAMEGAVQAGIRMAERHAATQVEKNPGHRLTATQYRDRAFSVSTRTITEELKTERNDLRNRLTGLKPAEIWYLQHNAYMVRMYELELERRSTHV